MVNRTIPSGQICYVLTFALHMKVIAQSVKTQISLISYEELNFWIEHGLEWHKVC